jgi:hypothetical protein
MSYTSVANAVRNVLATDADLIVLVPAARIYPQILPQNPTLPSIIYNTLSDEPLTDVSGMAGLFKAIIQIDIIATTALSAQTIAEKVRLLLQSYSGTSLSIVIKGIYFLMIMDGFETEVSNYRQILRFEAWYYRENPERD